jgi:DNA-directed RNA polymerase
VNAIQATPWIVNKCVLEVIQELVRNGGNIAGIPNIYEDTKPAVLPEEPTKEDIERYKAIMPKWYKGEKRRKSLVLRALYTLRTAEKFKDEDAIYFPCNMDFRGRIYPIPSFNFQGDDLTKSLILFKDAPPCKTTKDIEWLAITGANIAGHDKIAYADRVAWITRNETHILQSASDPLGYTWWAEQDEPCQMLAFCFEWARWCEWRETHQGDPSGFVTGLPSHQDGTCSGLQHFSAILRDEIGGTAVNLVPQDTPNDIYARVADEVNCLLREDSTKGTPDSVDEKTNKIVYGTRTCAQTWLSFGVTRKVTKRPTMTLAYGAREFGYREQIMTDTIEPAMREQGDACVFNDHNKWRMSGYMAKIIWRSVSKVVIKACEGMKWLQLCAQIVAKEGKPVTWVTPLGLPVQQEYLVDNCEIVQMTVANKRIRVYSHSVTGDIDKHKQANGIAPNFIHSMDASHLMLTVNACALAGIRHFSTIHDSYGCPIAQTETMYRCVRQAFVDMYTDNDVLKSFAEDMKHLTTHTLPALPSKGALHLQDVLDSKYIFC